MRHLAEHIRECLLDLTARMQRTMLLVVAVAMGTGALVASIGINQTASNQISNEMVAGTLDQISVRPSGGNTAGYVFPENSEELAQELPAVIVATRELELSASDLEANRFNIESTRDSGQKETQFTLSVLGVTSTFFETYQLTGGTAGNWVLDNRTEVNAVYLGEKAAEKLGIPTENPYPRGYSIHLDDQRTDVIGIIKSSARRNVDLAIIMPYYVALKDSKTDSMATLVARLQPGSGGPVSTVLNKQLRPEAPEQLSVSKVATLQSLRAGVDSQLARLGVTLGAMLLILTALLIANSMIVSVVSRTSEIGLRRALGSSKTDIAKIFLIEGAITGGLGGLAGGAIGLGTVMGVSLVNSWTPNFPWWLGGLGLGVGIVVGLIASLYPALSAARINPATAIRVD